MKDKIQIIFVRLMRIVMRLFYLFPIRKNRILFCSYKGKSCNCNPRYIFDAMIASKEKWELIWAVADSSAVASLPAGVKICGYHSLKYFYYLATCGAAVDNVGYISIYPTRKHQLLINTWHGGGCYKNVGTTEQVISEAKRERERISARNTKLYLSSSRYFTQEVIRGQLEYHGEVLEAGMPRNDVLVRGDQGRLREMEQRVRTFYGITDQTKIVLYAPTWSYFGRDNADKLDDVMVLDALTERFGGDWVMLLRRHLNIADNSRQQKEHVLLASDYPDMQELLVAADVLISDYSSCIWDYSFLYRPCFLFTPDLDEYMEMRGFGREIHAWGFPVCINCEELIMQISRFSEKRFCSEMKRHHRELGSCESGESIEQVIRKICNYSVNGTGTSISGNAE